MDIREMQCFIAIVEEGNLTKAAEKLYLTIPALSRMLNKIEKRLNIALFNKTKQPWILTYAGELYLKKAHTILRAEENFLQEVKNISSFSKGRLTLGIMAFEEKHIMPKILPLFYEQYPNFAMDLMDSIPAKMEDDILNNMVDFSFILYPPKSTEIEYVPIKTYQILLALPISHPLAKDYVFPEDNKSFPEINLALLSDYPFITMKPVYTLRATTINVCQSFGFKPKIILETEKMYTAHASVASGCGTTLILDQIIEYQDFKNKVAYFRIKGHELNQKIAFAYKKDKKLNTVEKDFLKILQENA